MPQGKWICMTNCIHLGRYWVAGESLNDTPGFEDAPPGKHFAKDGVPMQETQEIFTAGDDPRSTVQMVADMAEDHGIDVPEGTPRREVFNQWVVAEKAKAAKEPDAGSGSGAGPGADGVAKVDPLGTLKYHDLTPDQLHDLKNAELALSIEMRHGMSIANEGRGVSKENLIQQALQLEAHAEKST